MKKTVNIFKISVLIFSILSLTGCFNEEIGKVEFSHIPNEITLKEGEVQTITILASIDDNTGMKDDYIEKIEFVNATKIADEEYIGEADIILNDDSDGVSSKSFDIIANKSGMVAFDVVFNITQHSNGEDYQMEETARIEMNITKNEEINSENQPNTESEAINSEVQNIVENIPVETSAKIANPAFPNLGLPEYINLGKQQVHAMPILNLNGHTITQIKYANGVNNAYAGIGEVVVTAGDTTGAGYIDIYLKYPNFFYTAQTPLPAENPHGPYYRAENGYLVIRYDVNIRDEINSVNQNPNDYYVENELNKDIPKDYFPQEEIPKDYYEEYNPMIKN